MEIKVNDSFKYREIAGEYYLIPVGGAAEKYKTPLRLTETAAWIWTSIEAGKTREEIVAGLTKEFEVDPISARRDTDFFMSALLKKGILELSAGLFTDPVE